MRGRIVKNRKKSNQVRGHPYPFEYSYMLCLCHGLQSIIEDISCRHKKMYAEKVVSWREMLWEVFQLRVIRDGVNPAREWVLSQLVNPRLLDRRHGRSLPDDRLLIARYDVLKEELRPVFEACRRNPHNRNLRAAPIVSKILGRTFLPADLPSSPTVGRYCRDLLNAFPQLLARARKRVADEDRKKRSTMTQYFTQSLSSPNKTPHEIERLRKALALLKNAK